MEPKSLKLTSNEIKEGLMELHREKGIGEVRNLLKELVPGWYSAEELYQPSPELIARLADYEQWCKDTDNKPAKERKKYTDEDTGRLLEEIAYLTFDSIIGKKTIKSYQSSSSQTDLIVSSTEFEWQSFFAFIRLDTMAQTIVVEAKNIEGRVEDKHFGRVCGLLQYKYANTAMLGVFFSRKGASGFPRVGEDRQRSLSNSRATQLLFYARTNKIVVVFDETEIKRLGEPGFLPRLLAAKIRAVEEDTGLALVLDDEGHELDDLPPHLAKYKRPSS